MENRAPAQAPIDDGKREEKGFPVPRMNKKVGQECPTSLLTARVRHLQAHELEWRRVQRIQARAAVAGWIDRSDR